MLAHPYSCTSSSDEKREINYLKVRHLVTSPLWDQKKKLWLKSSWMWLFKHCKNTNFSFTDFYGKPNFEPKIENYCWTLNCIHIKKNMTNIITQTVATYIEPRITTLNSSLYEYEWKIAVWLQSWNYSPVFWQCPWCHHSFQPLHLEV